MLNIHKILEGSMNEIVCDLSKNSTRIDLFLRSRFLKKLGYLENAVLIISDSLGEHILGSEGSDGLCARINVLNMNFYRQLAVGGSVGAAQSYMDNDWEADDLCRVIQILVRNRDLLDSMEGGFASLANHFQHKNGIQTPLRSTVGTYHRVFVNRIQHFGCYN